MASSGRLFSFLKGSSGIALRVMWSPANSNVLDTEADVTGLGTFYVQRHFIMLHLAMC